MLVTVLFQSPLIHSTEIYKGPKYMVIMHYYYLAKSTISSSMSVVSLPCLFVCYLAKFSISPSMSVVSLPCLFVTWRNFISPSMSSRSLVSLCVCVFVTLQNQNFAKYSTRSRL